MTDPSLNSGIRRIGTNPRWSDVVIHRGVARWVEVAEDQTTDFRGQAQQVLSQIDDTLANLSAPRTSLLQVLIFIPDLQLAAEFNHIWDAWVPSAAAPVRACVQAGLAPGCQIELIIEAAVE